MLLLSIGACYISPAKYWFFQFFGLFFQIIFILNIFVLIFWTLKKSKIAYIHFVVLIAGILYTGRFFQFSGNKAEGETIKIISYNTHSFENINNGNHAYTEIADFLLAENADIICLQEYIMTDRTLKTNASWQKISEIYKYTSENHSGEKIFSKFPLANNEKPKNRGQYMTFANININNKTLRIYSCHLQSTNFNPDNTQKKLLKTDSYKRELKRIVVNLRNAFVKRAKQADFIAQSLSKSPYPAIICGDFNDTPMSYTYQKIRGNKKDTFIEAGSGIPNTYKKLMSFLRIDYIFTDRDIDVAEYRVAKEINCSDHYPIVVKLKIE
jgi:endonuclease/exonuclease/phosphatase family metal-dependent hydrolase